MPSITFWFYCCTTLVARSHNNKTNERCMLSQCDCTLRRSYLFNLFKKEEKTKDFQNPAGDFYRAAGKKGVSFSFFPST